MLGHVRLIDVAEGTFIELLTEARAAGGEKAVNCHIVVNRNNEPLTGVNYNDLLI